MELFFSPRFDFSHGQYELQISMQTLSTRAVHAIHAIESSYKPEVTDETKQEQGGRFLQV